MTDRIQYSISPIFDHNGNRKYLTRKERRAFRSAAEGLPSIEMRSFCLTLLHTGARLSEVRALGPAQVDAEAGVVVIRTLKQRRDNVYRAIPVPQDLLQDLNGFCRKKFSCAIGLSGNERIWPWGRTFSWKVVKKVMQASNIAGPHARPTGLRHGFAVDAIQSGVPLNVVSKWLGHARIETTAIYTNVVGEEERFFAEKMWLPAKT